MVLPLSNIVEIMKSNRINKRFIMAIIEPIIVNQFLEEGGSFMITGLSECVASGVKIDKYWINHQSIYKKILKETFSYLIYSLVNDTTILFIVHC